MGGADDVSNEEAAQVYGDPASFVDPPPVLYHYTSSQGLQGILESGNLWATDLQYLNDEQEFMFGRDRVIPAFREHVLKIDDGRVNKGILVGLIDHSALRDFYVTCFCENGDLLSQWRGYAAPGGYALGFDTQVSTPSVKRSLDYRRVYYGGEYLDSFVGALASVMAERYFEAFDADYRERLAAVTNEADFDLEEAAERVFKFTAFHYYRLELLSATMKHQAFAEEREWRIIADVYKNFVSPPVPYFRQGPLGLTPYVHIDMKCDNGRMPLREVVVGPGANMELRVAAVRKMLNGLGYGRSVEVRESEAPYRG